MVTAQIHWAGALGLNTRAAIPLLSFGTFEVSMDLPQISAIQPFREGSKPKTPRDFTDQTLLFDLSSSVEDLIISLTPLQSASERLSRL